jgi:AraC-like DNA-binding protein
MRLELKLPTVATLVEPSMQSQLDAAARGNFYSIHANSIQEVAKAVREGPASTVLFSARYIQSSQMLGVEDLVRNFPAISTVAVISSTERVEPKKILELGASGVKQLVDLCDRSGWEKLRSIISQPLDTAVARVVTAIIPALSQSSHQSRAFFEALFRVAPEITTVRGLCKVLSVHPSTMMSRFLRAGLPSPRRYLSWTRLVHAAGLLEDNGLSLADVAYRLDHSSPQSFGRHVKSLMDCTANQYRNHYGFDRTVELFLERMVTPYGYALATFEPLPTGVFPGRRRC